MPGSAGGMSQAVNQLDQIMQAQIDQVDAAKQQYLAALEAARAAAGIQLNPMLSPQNFDIRHPGQKDQMIMDTLALQKAALNLNDAAASGGNLAQAQADFQSALANANASAIAPGKNVSFAANTAPLAAATQEMMAAANGNPDIQAAALENAAAGGNAGLLAAQSNFNQAVANANNAAAGVFLPELPAAPLNIADFLGAPEGDLADWMKKLVAEQPSLDLSGLMTVTLDFSQLLKKKYSLRGGKRPRGGPRLTQAQIKEVHKYIDERIRGFVNHRAKRLSLTEARRMLGEASAATRMLSGGKRKLSDISLPSSTALVVQTKARTPAGIARAIQRALNPKVALVIKSLPLGPIGEGPGTLGEAIDTILGHAAMAQGVAQLLDVHYNLDALGKALQQRLAQANSALVILRMPNNTSMPRFYYGYPPYSASTKELITGRSYNALETAKRRVAMGTEENERSSSSDRS